MCKRGAQRIVSTSFFCVKRMQAEAVARMQCNGIREIWTQQLFIPGLRFGFIRATC